MRSARNSLKHGRLAKPSLVSGDSEQEFHEFTEGTVRELDPVSALERHLVEQIACHLWRLARMSRVRRASSSLTGPRGITSTSGTR